MSPVAPFYADYLYRNLNEVSQKQKHISVHLSDYPAYDESVVDKALEERMQIAQDLSSMILALRKKVQIKVRQPLEKILIPILNEEDKIQIDQIKDIVLAEVNVKELEYIGDTNDILKKKAKPDFKKLGRKLGANMGEAKNMIEAFTQADIQQIEQNGVYTLHIKGQAIGIALDEIVIFSEDIEGWEVNSMNGLTVALDIHISEELKQEGLARELVNKLQKLRKENDFNVTDRIELTLENHPDIVPAVKNFKSYICNEVLANQLLIVDELNGGATVIDVEEMEVKLKVALAE